MTPSRILNLILVFSLLGSQQGLAEKMDLSTHALVIEKLHRALDVTPDGTTSKLNLILRLADLHSEHGRLLAMDQEGKGENIHKKAIREDRKQALEMYEKGSLSVKGEKLSELFLQRAHLHEMLDEPKKANKLYEDILARKSPPELESLAHIGLGEQLFNESKFSKALSHFQKSYDIKVGARRGYALSRVAWCHFHIGNTQKALQNMQSLLTNPNLLKKKDGSHDQAFQEEASRDYATFLARNEVTPKDVETLSKLSPENAREPNLTYLAEELDRTGKKRSALYVWSLIGLNKQSPMGRLEGQIKVVQIQYDLGNRGETIREFKKAIEMWRKVDCSGPDCDALRGQLKKVVTDWNKAEEREPSAEVLQAYIIYTSEFQDIEMSYWGAQIAMKQKKWVDATRLFRMSSDLTVSQNKTKESKFQKIFEGSLLGEIESAENAGKPALKESAYLNYIKQNPQGAKAFEIRYQIAYLSIEKNDHRKAADSFRELALTSDKSQMSLREKSADLALDSLAILKQDQQIEVWALEFSKALPQKKDEYLKIARKASLNQAANRINQNAGSSDLKESLAKLENINLSGATVKEKSTTLKQRLLIANKLKDLAAMDRAAVAIIQSKDSTADEKNEAFKTKAWIAEMRLQFKDSVLWLKKMTPKKTEKAEHTLKIALMTELAGMNAVPDYENFIRISKNASQNQEAAMSIVRLSKNKRAALNQYQRLLRQRPELYATAILLAYQQKPDSGLLKLARSDKQLRTLPDTARVTRTEELSLLEKISQDAANIRVNSSTEKTLKISLKNKIDGIARIEREAQQAIQAGDWVLQIIALSSIARENQTLAHQIQALPMPRGLNKKQQKEYHDLLAAQSQPYTLKSKEVYEKAKQLWGDDNTLEALVRVASVPALPGHPLAQRELKSVTSSVKNLGLSVPRFEKWTENRHDLDKKRSELRELIRQNPFNSRYVEKLKDVEKESGHGPMVAYLSARMAQIEGGSN